MREKNTTRIFSMTQSQMNKAFDGFGDVLKEHLPLEKDKYVILHQVSINNLIANSSISPIHKQVIQVLVHFMNVMNYPVVQVVED